MLGLIGNVLSLIVWRKITKKREDFHKSAGFYLITLALIHSGLLLCFLSFETLPKMIPQLKNNIKFIIFSCYFGFPMYFFFFIASIWMLISITVNRFVIVICPHKAETCNNIGKTKVEIGTTILFSFIVNIPHFFNKRPRISNGTAKIITTDYGKGNGARMYELWVHCIFLILVPWIIVSSLNAFIIHKLLFRTRIQKHKKSGNKRFEYQATITILILSFTFLVLLLWQCITQCFWLFHYGINDSKIWTNVSSAYAPARLGAVIYSSMGFTIYYVSGSFFRKEMRNIFCYNPVDYTPISSTNTWGHLSQSQAVISNYNEILIDADQRERGTAELGYDPAPEV